MKLKKKAKKTFKIIIIVLLILGLSLAGYFVYKRFAKSTKTTTNKVVNEIKEYGYTLEDDAPKEYKHLFDELDKVLKAEEIDEEAYAKLVAQMLVFDFYNLDNKISKNDVGGTEFILSDYEEQFVYEATETVYKYIEHNVYGDRKQELPKVKNVSVESIRTNNYTYEKLSDDKAYIIKVNVEYEKDLGYPTEVTVKMLHNDKKLEVFYMK